LQELLIELLTLTTWIQEVMTTMCAEWLTHFPPSQTVAWEHEPRQALGLV
jgi:hypothetical protein